jgi:CheY-like chemotaxis protein
VTKNLSTFAIAGMLHVDPGSVANWIDQGLLKAYRTPGGHRRVIVDDLIEFLHQHRMPIPSEIQSAPTRILVVDDEPDVRRLIARAVKARFPDLEVLEANDAFQAGTLIATHRPDVVLLDLPMPGMDGFEVCRLIRSQSPATSAEVIAMAARLSPEDERRILECGARVCLRKPLDMDSVLKEIEASL